MVLAANPYLYAAECVVTGQGAEFAVQTSRSGHIFVRPTFRMPCSIRLISTSIKYSSP